MIFGCFNYEQSQFNINTENGFFIKSNSKSIYVKRIELSIGDKIYVYPKENDSLKRKKVDLLKYFEISGNSVYDKKITLYIRSGVLTSGYPFDLYYQEKITIPKDTSYNVKCKEY